MRKKERERERERRENKRMAEDKRREQRSYERVPVCLTVRCRVVGAQLAVSLSTCQPTHVGIVATAYRFTHRRLMPWSHARRDRTGRVLLQRASAISYACEERDQLGTSPRNESSERFAAYTRPSLVAELRLSIRSDFTRIY